MNGRTYKTLDKRRLPAAGLSAQAAGRVHSAAMGKTRRVIPGFGLSLGYTVLYLSLIVLVPLSAIFIKSASLGWALFWKTATTRSVMHAYKISFGTSLVAGAFSAVFGLLVAWTLGRYKFFGRRLIDAIIDLPFALPTAVAGIALTSLYNENGWLGRLIPKKGMNLSWAPPDWPILGKEGLKVAFTPVGITIALIFIGLPFVVRTVQPVLLDMGTELEEAAASLGATRWQTFRRVIFPELWPAVLSGFTLAVARSLGEYGSVIIISGNLPLRTQIAPALIIEKLELSPPNYAGATSIAVVMLVASFALLLLIAGVERITVRR